MYKNISFKHVISLNSVEDVPLVTRIFYTRHRGLVGFSVNSIGRDNCDIYMSSTGNKTSIEDIARFFKDVYSEVDIPETISFAFVNNNPSTEESGIVIFKPKVNGYYVITPKQLIEQHINQESFNKGLIELH